MIEETMSTEESSSAMEVGDSSTTSHSVLKEHWEEQAVNHHVSRSDLNVVIMEYLVREGFRDAAQEFQKETGLDPRLETSVMDCQIEIRKSIEAGDVQRVVETVNDLDPDILDLNAQLFFHLQLQQLLEYICHGDIDGALMYAQSELAARGEENPEFLSELEEALSLLAYEDPSKSPFGSLLQNSQQLKIISELNSAILTNKGLESGSRLSMLMKLVLWAQTQLDKKNLLYPKLNRITDGALSTPVQDSSVSTTT